MHKIWLIIQREYLVRVRKKSFIIMTLLGPILLASIMVVPIWLASVSDTTNTIEVLDESGLFVNAFKDTNETKYIPVSGSLETHKTAFLQTNYTALLYIPKLNLDKPEGIRLYSKTNLGISKQLQLENILKKEIETLKFKQSGIDREVLEKMKTNVSINTTNLTDNGEQNNNAMVTTAAGYVGAFLIYMFIFIYGVQIMRGVIEEKTNRIVEVIISSVKPFQLMAGKIIGIAAVGLTQFLLWIILSAAVTTVVSSRFEVDRFSDARISETLKESKDPAKAKEMNNIVSALDSLNVPLLLGCFVFYFLGGYLLYGALFGAVGSAVDNETDTQQFMLPITIPLVLSFIVAQTVIIKNPDGPVAFWMSMIPFTSPIAMMLRLPFGVPYWQILLSMFFLILGFVFTTWIAARIYRVGILLYGKKPTYKELSKWLFY
ncbi:ABC transporter permease [Adhaeribacter radiodurans]|uniref:ABC transporter permease n=1 Tax=Adhaeribacter radiodurans TaxID=2745197 RepID=A0A7L7L491_9BACT|nr:ABC transporter permease [Adhaeribacter radiodurans]QMU27584.1 ABC transporter permease [Adhaeribacter radiodurans]